MPELPEVETTVRGISPYIIAAKIIKAELRNQKLRWPVPRSIVNKLRGLSAMSVSRRGKYILIQFEPGCMMIHLGMSGSLRLVPIDTPPEKHDHFDLCLETGYLLRYRDPRRFGSIHWLTGDPENHALLKDLGPEPLSRAFNGEYLFIKSRNKKRVIKTFIMDSRVVVGVGNIYASEALYDCGIRPGNRTGRLSRERCNRLTQSIKKILNNAILKGGTTLRDFVDVDGNPGYFQQTLNVYGRAGLPCRSCYRPSP